MVEQFELDKIAPMPVIDADLPRQSRPPLLDLFNIVRENTHRFGSWAKKHPVQTGLLAIGAVVGIPTLIAPIVLSPISLHQIQLQSGPYYEWLLSKNSELANTPVGQYLLTLMSDITFTGSSSVPLAHPDDVPFVHMAEYLQRAYIQNSGFLALLGGATAFASTKLPALYDYIVKGRDKRIDAGEEMVKSKEVPQHVFFGSTDIISDMCRFLAPEKEDGGIYVGIHFDRTLPPVRRNEMDYHYNPSGTDEIISDRFGPAKIRIPFIRATGIDRARELTFICYNPENAIFYGGLSQSQLTLKNVTDILAAMSPEQLSGKKINIILPAEKQFAGAVEIDTDVLDIKREFGIEVNVIRPELLVLEKIKEALIGLGQKKQGDLHVVLAGEGKTKIDHQMLAIFKSAIEALGKDEQLNRNVIVDLVSRTEAGKIKLQQKEASEEDIKTLIENSDLNICYGDDDSGTSTVAGSLRDIIQRVDDEEEIKKRKTIFDNKTMCIAERMARKKIFARRHMRTIFIPELLKEAMQTRKNDAQ